MSRKAEACVIGLMCGLFFAAAGGFSIAARSWVPLWSCAIALGIAFTIMGITWALCSWADRRWPR